jgi:sugar/nucleoside kinase (ribokinase family)
VTSLLVVGEVLAEFMRPTRDSPLNETAVMMGPFPSGAPGIFASAAARLGIPTALCAAVGDDPFGQLIRDRLEHDGVDVDGVLVDPTRTTAVAFVAYTSTGERSFVFHVSDAAAARLRPVDLGRRPEETDWLHISGSSLALGSPLAETAIQAASRVKRAGGRVSVDPNVRAEASTRAVLASIRSLAQQADVLFPSEGELDALRLEEEELLAAGACICTTLAAEGARVRSGGLDVHVPAPAANEVDPTGAGDIFAAGFVAATLRGADPVEAAQLGCGIAARSVGTLGSMESAIDALEVERTR